MYSIGEMAELTGITAFTLRYYEKIGVLPEARRKGGVRTYNDEDLRFIRFIHGLKQTGMSLEDIAAFTEDGCLLSPDRRETDLNSAFIKRIEMLDRHVARLDEQIKHLQTVKATALDKQGYYSSLLSGRKIADVQKQVKD